MTTHVQPGEVYRHYKGGFYLVVAVAETHNHNGDRDVVYYSFSHKKHCTRPLEQDSRKEDSWNDAVLWPDGVHRERFLPEKQFQSWNERTKAELEKAWEGVRG